VGTNFRVITRPIWRLPSQVPVVQVERDLFRVTEWVYLCFWPPRRCWGTVPLAYRVFQN